VKIKKSEAFQYKPDAQARDAEILGNIPSLARFEVALYRPIPKGFKLLAGDKRSAITGFGRQQT
jgi:hypothetical protein